MKGSFSLVFHLRANISFKGAYFDKSLLVCGDLELKAVNRDKLYNRSIFFLIDILYFNNLDKNLAFLLEASSN